MIVIKKEKATVTSVLESISELIYGLIVGISAGMGYGLYLGLLGKSISGYDIIIMFLTTSMVSFMFGMNVMKDVLRKRLIKNGVVLS